MTGSEGIREKFCLLCCCTVSCTRCPDVVKCVTLFGCVTLGLDPCCCCRKQTRRWRPKTRTCSERAVHRCGIVIMSIELGRGAFMLMLLDANLITYTSWKRETTLHLLILKIELLHREIPDLDPIRTDEHTVFRETGEVSFALDSEGRAKML